VSAIVSRLAPTSPAIVDGARLFDSLGRNAAGLSERLGLTPEAEVGPRFSVGQENRACQWFRRPAHGASCHPLQIVGFAGTLQLTDAKALICNYTFGTGTWNLSTNKQKKAKTWNAELMCAKAVLIPIVWQPRYTDGWQGVRHPDN